MREMSINVYKASELEEKALEKAYYDWLDTGIAYSWTEDNKNTLDEFEKLFPVKIKKWEYDTTSGHVSFEFTESDDIEELTGQRLATYIWNNYRYGLFTPKIYWSNKLGSFKKRTSKIKLQTDCVLTGYCIDDDILDPVYKFLKKPCEHTNFYDLMRDCFQSWVNACSNDFEACTSQEYFIEHSDENGYEYDEHGRMM